ncbi:MAG: hypothetical protein ACP5UZ_08725 [Thermoplasmata archaeon]
MTEGKAPQIRGLLRNPNFKRLIKLGKYFTRKGRSLIEEFLRLYSLISGKKEGVI